MLSELPKVIGDRLHGAGTILAAICHLTDNPPTSTFFGRDLAEWRHRGWLWLLNESSEARDEYRHAIQAAYVAGCVSLAKEFGHPTDDLDEAGYDYADSVMEP